MPLRLVFNPIGDLLAATRACEADVFRQTYGNTEAEFAAEYGPYEDATIFMALVDESGKVVAACRIIRPGQAGLKALNDAAKDPWNVDGLRSARAARIDPAHTWEIATICIRPDAGAGRVLAAAALYHAIARAARVNGIRSLVMIMDERARHLLSATGVMTRPLPGTHAAPYLGSPASTPVYGHFAEMADLQRRTNPEAHRLIDLGVGLDGISVPAAETFRLRDAGESEVAFVADRILEVSR